MAQSKRVARTKGRDPTKEEMKIIWEAVKNDDVDSLEDLIKSGINVTNADFTDGINQTALHEAARHGSYNITSTLIRSGANVNAITKVQYTPLHWAARYGYTNCVALLVTNGADVNMKDVDGNTSLQLAVWNNHSSTVAYLVNEAGVKTTQYDEETQNDIRQLLKEAETSTISVDKHDKSPDPQDEAMQKSDSLDANLVMAYEVAMKEGSESSNQFKLVTLGAEGAGKTSSINTLLNIPFQSNQESTVGASVNSCTVDMHLATSKWKKVTATFRITEIPKLYNKEINATVLSSPAQPVNLGSVKPPSQKVIDQVKKIIASKEEIPPDGHVRIMFDIGGQEVYYDIHFLFLAIEDVALLVFDCSKDLDDQVISRHRTGRFGEKIATRKMMSNIETIELLLHSVYSRGQKAPAGSISLRLPVVIMLGTHAEDLSDEKKEMIIQTIYQRFDGKAFLEHLPQSKREAFHFLANSNPNPKSVEDLRSTVLKAAELVITTKRPISYLKFEGKILEKIQEAEVRISQAGVVDVARDAGVEGEQAVDALLQYFTNKGILLYYPEVTSLKDDIFISPQEVSDLVCTVITTHECRPPTASLQQSYQRYNQHALLEEALLNFILLQCKRSKDKAVLLGLLDKFNLATEVPANTRFSYEGITSGSNSSKVFVVPSLFVYDNKVPYHKQDGDIVVQYYYPDKFLPESIFNQLLVKTIRWCCKCNHMIRCIRRGIGYFSFEDARWQQFQLQWCQFTSSINCYITIQQSHHPHSEMLPVLLQQRRQLLTYLECSIAEITRCCMPSAKPPLTCLECPLHEEECTPHVILDINKKVVLVCHKELLATIVPEKFYILLYQDQPNLRNLLPYFQGVSNWKELGLYLLPEKNTFRINDIERSYPHDVAQCRWALITEYLKVGEISWSKVIDALKKSGHPNTSKRIRSNMPNIDDLSTTSSTDLERHDQLTTSETEKATKPLANHNGYKHSPVTSGKEVDILFVIFTALLVIITAIVVNLIYSEIRQF